MAGRRESSKETQDHLPAYERRFEQDGECLQIERLSDDLRNRQARSGPVCRSAGFEGGREEAALTLTTSTPNPLLLPAGGGGM